MKIVEISNLIPFNLSNLYDSESIFKSLAYFYIYDNKSETLLYSISVRNTNNAFEEIAFVLSKNIITDKTVNNNIEWIKINETEFTKVNVQYNQIILDVYDEKYKKITKPFYLLLSIFDNFNDVKTSTLPNIDTFTDSFRNFCTLSSDNNCIVNLDTKEPFKKCLNWRRIDNVGNYCRKILKTTELDSSINKFCSENLYAEDCQCINRQLYDEYKNTSNYYTTHDYCWYSKCKNGNYLLNNVQNIPCDNKICNVIFETEKNTGNINIDTDQIGIHCSDVISPADNPDNPNNPDSKYVNWIIISAVVLLFLLIIFKN